MAIDRDKLAVRKLGRYTVIQEIARGGAGVVYQAIDPTLGRKVALKVLRDERGDMVERLRREGVLAGRLSHPGIVNVIDIGEAHDPRSGEMSHYIAMDLVEGTDLERALPELALADRVELLKRVADAVGYAHEQGVIHRDLKPANILLDEQARPIVTDFGLARSEREVSDLTTTGDMLGTAHYMAPEQVLGMRDTDARTDVWALGVILYRLLTDRLPFPGRTSAEVYDRIIRYQPQPPRRLVPNLPVELETIALVALEKAPKRRYPDASALRADLERWQQGKPLLARPPSLPVRLLRRVTRRPALLVAGLLAALVWTAIGLSMLAASQREAASQALARTLLAQSKERVAGLLQPAVSALKGVRRQLSRDADLRARDGLRSPDPGRDPLARELLAQLADWPTFTWVSWSTPDGDFVGAYRLAGSPTAFVNKSYFVDGDGQAHDYRVEHGEWTRLDRSPWGAPPDYDPRTRPFYKRAVASGTVSWTKPYVFWGSYPGISCAVPVHADGEIAGVATIDFEIWQLSAGLREVAAERGAPFATIAVVSPTGEIVAHSGEMLVGRSEPLIRKTPDGDVLRRYEDLGDPLLTRLAEALGGPRLGAPAELLIDAGDGAGVQRVVMRPLHAVEGLPLVGIVAVPEARAQRASTRLLGRLATVLWWAAGVLAILGGLLIQRHLASPFRHAATIGTSSMGSKLGSRQ